MLLRVAKLLWYLSFPGFLAAAVYVYIYLPDRVRLLEGSTAVIISKNVFFYGAIALMVFINFAVNFAGGMLAFLPAPFLLIPKRKIWTAKLYTRKVLATKFKNWFRGSLFFINIFLVLVCANLYVYNTPDTIVDVTNYFYVVAAFLVLWCVYFPIAFLDTTQL